MNINAIITENTYKTNFEYFNLMENSKLSKQVFNLLYKTAKNLSYSME